MYRIIHSFYRTESLAKKNLTAIKRKWPEAKLVHEQDGIALILFETYDQDKAYETLHNVFTSGLWGSVEIKNQSVLHDE